MPNPLRIHPIRNGNTYVHPPNHRNGTATKAQWSIQPPEERNVFAQTLNHHWIIDDSTGWGLLLIKGVPKYLGSTPVPRRPSFVAKFVRAHTNQPWHGYPADYQRRRTDIPDTDILALWITADFLPKAKISKLNRGILWSL